jgi:hypothetical protein
MNKIKLLLSFSIVIVFVSCKNNNNDFNVNSTINKYNLDLNSGYNLKIQIGKETERYGNKKTDSCLIVLINKKGDTILTHLDKGIESWYPARMIKTESEYFVIKGEFNPVQLDSTKPDYKPLSEATGDYSYNDTDYPMNNYYVIDTINKDLKKIKLVSKSELIKRNKGKFNFSGTNIIASSNRFIYLAKDTLKGYQIYYQVNTKYELEKRGTTFVLFPNLSSNSEDIFKIGLYKNNQNISTQYLGNTQILISQDSIGHNVNKYAVLLRFYSRFFCDSINYKYCHDEFEKLDVVLCQRGKKEQVIMKTFTSNSFFKDKRFNMFKYKNADYFWEYCHPLIKNINLVFFD